MSPRRTLAPGWTVKTDGSACAHVPDEEERRRADGAGRDRKHPNGADGEELQAAETFPAGGDEQSELLADAGARKAYGLRHRARPAG